MRSKIKLSGDLIGLDLGKSRSGVARINVQARLSEPLDEITMDDRFFELVQEVVQKYDACCIVAGLPRGLDGQHTEQTQWAQNMVEELRDKSKVSVFAVDEAGTTKAAEQRSLPGQSVDSVAACIIVEDFLNEVTRGNIEGVYV